MVNASILTDDEMSVLRGWGIHGISDATLPSTGVQNRVVLVDADQCRCVLRGHRHHEFDRGACEHAIIEHARAHGIATPRLLRRPDGATLYEAHGRYWSVFELASGSQVAREDLDAGRAAAMGEFLARLHRALGSFRDSRLRPLCFSCDRDATQTRLDELIGLVEGLRSSDPVDGSALERLRSRRDWLQSGEAAGIPSEFWHLPVQALHGDYQESNLFFDDRGVSSVIDWDKALVGPSAWELVRVLDLSLRLDPVRCAAFLGGYARGGEVVASDQLRLAALAYSSMRAHDLWLYETVYRDGNARARRFITPARFVPFATRWEAFWRTIGAAP